MHRELQKCFQLQFYYNQHLSIYTNQYNYNIYGAADEITGGLKKGEIDIIAIDNNVLVFVEVKYRATNAFGRPIEAITPQKVHKIQITSQVFLKLKGWLDKNFRYDVIEIIDDELRHIINAF